MKRVLLLMLSYVMTTIVLAQNVTPEQALQKARKFMESHGKTGNSGPLEKVPR